MKFLLLCEVVGIVVDSPVSSKWWRSPPLVHCFTAVTWGGWIVEEAGWAISQAWGCWASQRCGNVNRCTCCSPRWVAAARSIKMRRAMVGAMPVRGHRS